MRTFLKVSILCLVATGLLAIPAYAVYNATDFFVSGRLGVGTDTPATKLHVQQGGRELRFAQEGTFAALRLQDLTGSNNTTVIFQNSGQKWQFRMRGDDANKFEIFDGTNVRRVLTLDTAGRVGINQPNPQTALDVAGSAKINGTGTVNVLEILGGADLAENFNVSPAGGVTPEPGMVVSINTQSPGELVVSTRPNDTTVVGIISGAGGLESGMRMGHVGTVANGSEAIALSGRVYCYVDASFGAVKPGDFLSTSSTPGHAMKVDASNHDKAQGAIIGKAMSGLEQGKGLVLVLVNLQ